VKGKAGANGKKPAEIRGGEKPVNLGTVYNPAKKRFKKGPRSPGGVKGKTRREEEGPLVSNERQGGQT